MAIQIHDISASRSDDGEVVERVEFTDRDSAWWHGTYQGGRIKTAAEVRVKLAINHDGAPIADLAHSRYAGAQPTAASAVQFKRGGDWIDRYALKGDRGEAGEEHKAIANAALTFAQAVLDEDPDICRRAQIAWHRDRSHDFERGANAYRRRMQAAQESRARHEKAIAELERGYTAGTME